MTIGVFDSGAGAYLIVDAIRKKIPTAQILIKTDSQFFPYGNKSPRFIQSRLAHFTTAFQKEGCQIVVIACNTATTNGIELLRRRFPDMQFVGIEPPVKPIVQLTKTGKVAVIGTAATMRSKRLKELVRKFSKGVSVELIPCPGLAELIEQTQGPTPKSEKLIKKFLDQPISGGVDVVGLACTHYPYLLPLMKKLYPKVTFFDPTTAVVSRVELLTKVVTA